MYRGARKLGQFDPAWVAVLVAYVAVFGGMLMYSDFLPFTFDNNESFAAYLHARNMYEFGIAGSSGLPDESLSNDVAAHPYLYTHAGASPRLFAYVLYVLGVRTVQLQIAVTAFTIGLLAFWFVYRFLADISTRLYAVVACLLLMTDYIMFAQWHIGLWHVWKTLLLFGGLYLAQRVAGKEQSRPLLAVYAFHAFLFYYETIFNVYVAAALFGRTDISNLMLPDVERCVHSQIDFWHASSPCDPSADACVIADYNTQISIDYISQLC